MTIAIAANFTEGIVFGADSSVTYSDDGKGISQVYEGAQKIYHLGKAHDCSDSPYGAMIYGSAEYEGQSWRNILANFWQHLGKGQTEKYEQMLSAFLTFLKGLQPDVKKRSSGGIFLAGFGEADDGARCCRISMDTLDSEEVPMRGLYYDGLPFIVQRLLIGFDTQTEAALRKQFHGVKVEIQDKKDGKKEKKPLDEVILDVIRRSSLKCQPDVAMPLRDAIDYVHFLVYSTIKHFKFNHGAPVCGGVVELAVITLDRGFRRVRRKPLDSQLV